MDKVPVEILREIFMEAIVSLYWYLDVTEYTIPQDLLLCLTHVCRAWRDVAISYKALWSYLLISRYGMVGREHIKTLVDLWLERSKDAPLTFKFDLSHKGPSLHDVGEMVISVAKALLSQQHRWKDVEFAWPQNAYIDSHSELRCLPEHSFRLANMPMLESLCVHWNWLLQVEIDLRQSSKLREIELAGNYQPICGKDTLPLLRSKARLTMGRGDFVQDCARLCRNFLEAASFLEELHLRIHWGSQPWPPTVETHILTVPRLRLLKIYSDERGPISLLDSVSLPALQALEIESTSRDEPIVNLIKRSSPPLTFLSLNFQGFPEESVIEMLQMLPTLEDFRYFNATVSTRFFHALMVDNSEEGRTKILCPKLETLYLRWPNFLEDAMTCGQSLLDMLESRQQIMPHFKEVGLSLRTATRKKVSKLRKMSADNWEEWSLSGRMFVTPHESLSPSPFNLTRSEMAIARLVGD